MLFYRHIQFVRSPWPSWAILGHPRHPWGRIGDYRPLRRSPWPTAIEPAILNKP